MDCSPFRKYMLQHVLIYRLQSFQGFACGSVGYPRVAVPSGVLPAPPWSTSYCYDLVILFVCVCLTSLNMFLQRCHQLHWQAHMCPAVSLLELAEQAVSGTGQPLVSSHRHHLCKPHFTAKTLDLYQPQSVCLFTLRL